MKQGAVAVLDALGFKGIWKIADNERKVIKVMKQVALVANAFQRHIAQISDDATGHMAHAFSIRLFSDSVIVSCCSRFKFEKIQGLQPASKGDFEQMFADVMLLVSLYMVTTVVSNVCGLTSSTDPVLLYRGAVACGSVEAADECFVGPAIDDAASMMDKADGPFVLLCPSARSVLGKSVQDLPEKIASSAVFARDRLPLILDYPVPLKDGRTYVGEILNPLMFAAKPSEQAAAMLRSFDAAMPLTLDLEIKKRNTAELLSRAAKDLTVSALRADFEARVSREAGGRSTTKEQ